MDFSGILPSAIVASVVSGAIGYYFNRRASSTSAALESFKAINAKLESKWPSIVEAHWSYVQSLEKGVLEGSAACGDDHVQHCAVNGDLLPRAMEMSEDPSLPSALCFAFENYLHSINWFANAARRFHNLGREDLCKAVIFAYAQRPLHCLANDVRTIMGTESIAKTALSLHGHKLSEAKSRFPDQKTFQVFLQFLNEAPLNLVESQFDQDGSLRFVAAVSESEENSKEGPPITEHQTDVDK